MNKYIFITLFLFLFSVRLDALIVFGGDNNATTSAPEGVDLPWDANARVANFNGDVVTGSAGSAVHLGFGYMLTAHHVANSSHVSFDGVTWYERDTGFVPVQVAVGVDLKVFKLLETPAVNAVTLHPGGSELNTLGYHVGWGRGRASDGDIGEDVQAFSSSNATIDKRWGTNEVKAVQQQSWTIGSTGYTQQTLVTVLGNSESPNEAALGTFDSGSGYYQEHNGSIVLAGIGGAIQQQSPGSATFGGDRLTGSGRGDQNFMIQVGPYANDIMAIIPEPRFYGLATGLLLFALVAWRRREMAI
jgi:hypothetical protein